MGKAIKDFKCKVTKKIYRTGSTYDGDRLEELQQLGYVTAPESEDQEDKDQEDPNQQNDNTEWPKHNGGGNYVLSNGEKIKGKDAAVAAQAKIDASGN